MDPFDRLYRLYTDFDTERVRDHRRFVDLFPPIDSPAILSYWHEADARLKELKADISGSFEADGDAFAELAATATQVEAFTALDLVMQYDRAVNVLVLDVDDTLRTAGTTDNEIPRETLHLLTQWHEEGHPIVICTGQTLEHVKGFLIQGLGNDVAMSDSVAVVYEAGSGVFAPGHGAQSKQLLYADLDDTVRGVFDRLRTRALEEAPPDIRGGCHLQGNEFNVTLKPNHEVGTEPASRVIDAALGYLLDLLDVCIAETIATDAEPDGWARDYYAASDPEIQSALDHPSSSRLDVTGDIPDVIMAVLDRLDVGYYAADAVEVRSLELNKVVGVEAALDVLGVDDPFALVMGDSKSDLRVMEWAAETNAGIAAAPRHASQTVLDHVRDHEELVFDPGDAAEMLRIALAMDRLTEVEGIDAT